MRLKLFIFFVLIYAFPVISQVNFPDSNAIWNVNTISSTGTPNGEILYKLIGDTLINDTLYNKLYLLTDTTIESENLKEYLGGFRQHDQKVWFRARYGNIKEFLLYDFAREIGDTIWHMASLYIKYNNEHEFTGGENYSVVQNIINDSGNNLIELQSPRVYLDEWISGIGSKFGLFGSIVKFPLSGISYHLACYKQNDTIKYKDNLICNKCFCNGSASIDENNDESVWLIIFPNPVKNTLTINIKKPFNQISIEFIDTMGKNLFTMESLDNQINIPNELSGIYFMKLKIDNEIFIKKIIIN